MAFAPMYLFSCVIARVYQYHRCRFVSTDLLLTAASDVFFTSKLKKVANITDLSQVMCNFFLKPSNSVELT